MSTVATTMITSINSAPNGPSRLHSRASFFRGTGKVAKWRAPVSSLPAWSPRECVSNHKPISRFSDSVKLAAMMANRDTCFHPETSKSNLFTKCGGKTKTIEKTGTRDQGLGVSQRLNAFFVLASGMQSLVTTVLRSSITIASLSAAAAAAMSGGANALEQHEVAAILTVVFAALTFLVDKFHGQHPSILVESNRPRFPLADSQTPENSSGDPPPTQMSHLETSMELLKMRLPESLDFLQHLTFTFELNIKVDFPSKSDTELSEDTSLLRLAVQIGPNNHRD